LRAADEDGAAVEASGDLPEFQARVEDGFDVDRGGLRGVEQGGEIALDEVAGEGEGGVGDKAVEGGAGCDIVDIGLQAPGSAGEGEGEVGGERAWGGLAGGDGERAGFDVAPAD